MALTAHFDPSNNANVLRSGAIPAIDAAAIVQWQDEGGLDLALYPGVSPNYRSTTPLMLNSCVDFDGTTHGLVFWNNANSVTKPMSAFVGASAKTVIIALYIEGITLNDAAAYLNDAVLVDDAGYFGIYLKNSTPKKIIAYNWDGNEDSVQLDVSLNTSYVVAARHNGTNLYMSLDGGSESSTASGATTDLTNDAKLGSKGIRPANIRVGEFKIWDEDRVATLAADIAYFTAKWLPAPPTGSGTYRMGYRAF